MKTSMACTGMLSYENEQHVNHHSSRAHGTVFCLQTSMSLTRNIKVKVAVELYYAFSKILKFGYC